MIDKEVAGQLAAIDSAVDGLILHLNNVLFIVGSELENRITDEEASNNVFAAAYACKRAYRAADVVHDYLGIIESDAGTLRECVDSIYTYKKSLKQEKPE